VFRVWGSGFRVEGSTLKSKRLGFREDAFGPAARSGGRRERAALEERASFECRLPTVLGGLVFEAHRLLYHSTLGVRNGRRRERPALEERASFKSRLATVLGGLILRLIGFCVTQL